ncbi:MAG: hypothetical protein LBI63_03480 [Candidatus Ancillula sp.]|jgi:hypothetical protein|nr:hypothetical protein [Candidatus Ancillula sp.]
MIRLLLKRFLLLLKSIYLAIPVRFLSKTISFASIIALFVLSYSLFSRYNNFTDGIHSFESENYSASISSFQAPEYFFELDSWEKSFNIATAYFGANLQTEARENFDIAKQKASKINDPRPLCMIDTNTAYSYEKSAQNQGEKIATTSYPSSDNTAKANDVRFQAQLYTEAYLIRERVNTYCEHLDTNELKINDELLDVDRSDFEKLNQMSFSLDGKTSTAIEDTKTKINKEFEKRQNEANGDLESYKTTSKIEELIAQNDKSEVDYKNAQNQKDSTPNSSTEHPY